MSRRWVLLGGLWLVYASFGLVAGSVAPLISPIREDLGLSQSAMGSILGAWPLVYLVVAIPAGVFVDRIGIRVALMLGGSLIALSGFLRAVATGHLSLFAAVAVFGVGGPLISIGAPKLIASSFEGADRGTAMGIYVTAPAVGRIVAVASANSVLMPLSGDSWRSVLTIYATIALLGVVAWMVISRGSSPAFTPTADTTTFDETATPVEGSRQLVRQPLILFLLVLTIGTFWFGHSMSNWLVEILRDAGRPASQAGFLASVPTAIGLVAAILVPRRATPSRRVPLLISLFVIDGLAMVLLVWAGGPVGLLGLTLVGLTRSTIGPIIMLMLMDAPRVSAANMGAAAGLYFTAGEIGGVLGPLTTGVLADLTGGFTVAVLVLGGMALLLGIVTGTVGRRLLPTTAATQS